MTAKASDAKIAVLGTGMVGRAIARELAANHNVVAVDANPGALTQFDQTNIATLSADMTRHHVLECVIADCSLVVNALPGRIGFNVLKGIIQCGKSVVDISFSAEDPMALDGLAKEMGVTAVVDCGIAPGFSNMVLGYHAAQMEVSDFVCYVGGLPRKKEWPFKYKAPFSPSDVIEEYVRPARLMETGAVVIKEALSDLEHVHFDGIGTLEAFNTDGLRTLLQTVDVPNMREKTLRYAGHSEYIKVLRAAGFFDDQVMDIKGVQISPLEFTSRVLFPKWRLEPREDEFTVMKIRLSGREGGKDVSYCYDVYDQFDPKSGLSSMSRTTGYTCSAVANLVMSGKINSKGIIAPELIAQSRDNFEFVLCFLKSKGISLQITTAQPGADPRVA